MEKQHSRETCDAADASESAALHERAGVTARMRSQAVSDAVELLHVTSQRVLIEQMIVRRFH